MPKDTRHNNFAQEHFDRQYHENDMMHEQFLEKELLQKHEIQSPKITYKGAANEQDSLALVALYNATGGDNWDNNTNWLTGNVAEWYGILVNGDGRVTEINLSSNQLTGSIPVEIGDLTSLTKLFLCDNQLTGSIGSL